MYSYELFTKNFLKEGIERFLVRGTREPRRPRFSIKKRSTSIIGVQYRKNRISIKPLNELISLIRRVPLLLRRVTF